MIAVALLAIPSLAFADGGGPLLLLINFSTFIVGQIWIIGIEWLLYTKYAKLTSKESLVESLVVNLASTVAIGFGFPLVLAIIGALGSMLPLPYKNYFLLLGTWIFDGIPYKSDTLIIVTMFGFVLTFILTVPFEAWCLKMYWNKKQISTEISAIKLSWICNFISYIGLVIIALVMWQEILIK